MADILTKPFQSSLGAPAACPGYGSEAFWEGSVVFGAAAGWSCCLGTARDSVTRVFDLGFRSAWPGFAQKGPGQAKEELSKRWFRPEVNHCSILI